MNEFTESACYNAGPRAMGQRAERGFDGPKTLSEGESRSQDGPSKKWALDWQVAGRRGSVGWQYRATLQVGSPGHNKGLPNTETCPARSGSSTLNHQQPDVPSKAYCN